MPLDRNWHEQKVLDDLAEPAANGEIEIVSEADPLIQRLVSVFPVEMDRVAWHMIPGVHQFAVPRGSPGGNFQLVEPALELRGFWDGVLRDNGIGGDDLVIVIGDSLIGFALKMSIVTLSKYLIPVFGVPQYTYVFPEDVSWCLCYTFEDVVYFAMAPPGAPGRHKS